MPQHEVGFATKALRKRIGADRRSPTKFNHRSVFLIDFVVGFQLDEPPQALTVAFVQICSTKIVYNCGQEIDVTNFGWLGKKTML